MRADHSVYTMNEDGESEEKGVLKSFVSRVGSQLYYSSSFAVEWYIFYMLILTVYYSLKRILGSLQFHLGVWRVLFVLTTLYSFCYEGPKSIGLIKASPLVLSVEEGEQGQPPPKQPRLFSDVLWDAVKDAPNRLYSSFVLALELELIITILTTVYSLAANVMWENWEQGVIIWILLFFFHLIGKTLFSTCWPFTEIEWAELIFQVESNHVYIF